MKKSKSILASTMVTGALVMQGTISNAQPLASVNSLQDETLRPFHVDMPQKKLDDLKRRILATQWPEKETVNDDSQGVPLATMKELANYWATSYDWRKVEAKLNSYPQFITNIDGLDI